MRVVFAFLLVGAGLALAGCGDSSNSSTAAETATTNATTAVATTTTSSTTAPTPARIDIRVVGGKPVGGIKHTTVAKGRRVILTVHSDVADEVHLHGYDLHQDVDASGTATIRFDAKIVGEFEAELESRKLQILALTVR